MEKLVETLGITRLPESQVSNMAKELDEQVADFRSRPLDSLVMKLGEAANRLPRLGVLAPDGVE